MGVLSREAHGLKVLVVLLVDHLVEGQPLALDVEESVGEVEDEVLDDHAEQSLLEDLEVAWVLIEAELPRQPPVVPQADEQGPHRVGEANVDHVRAESAQHDLPELRRVLLPGPRLVLLDLVLLKEGVLSPVDQVLNEHEGAPQGPAQAVQVQQQELEVGQAKLALFILVGEKLALLVVLHVVCHKLVARCPIYLVNVRNQALEQRSPYHYSRLVLSGEEGNSLGYGN
mmetsp:Transcript_9323/g.15717  ORF Transcript_9323/g.15717 Transcript_9323/m.15717 type:complete len:228 (+) Transcript_9323:374-1057(+)